MNQAGVVASATGEPRVSDEQAENGAASVPVGCMQS